MLNKIAEILLLIYIFGTSIGLFLYFTKVNAAATISTHTSSTYITVGSPCHEVGSPNYPGYTELQIELNNGPEAFGVKSNWVVCNNGEVAQGMRFGQDISNLGLFGIYVNCCTLKAYHS